MRTLLTGVPRAGKTTMGIELAAQHQCLHFCTDPQDLCPAGVAGAPLDLSWSENSLWVAQHWLELDGPWVIEGVAVPRALRKWRAMHEGKSPPCDRLIVLTEPHCALTPGQDAMGVGLRTVLQEMEDWLAPVLVWA